MALSLPLGLQVQELDLLLFITSFAIGIYLNWDWTKIAKKYVRLEQQLYHPLIRRYEAESGERISIFMDPKPLPFFDYVFRIHSESILKKIAWWIRSLFLLGLIAMNWWIVIILLLITRQIPTKFKELVVHGIHYKKYDNDFLLDALAYHLAFLAATILLLKMNFFSVVFQQVLGTTQLFGLTAEALHLVLFIWGILYLIADALTAIFSIHDHRRWRNFWLRQFNKFPPLKENFPEYHELIRKNKLYPADLKYVLGCLINIVLVMILFYF